MKANKNYHNESAQLKGSIPEPAQRFSRDWEKYTKMQGECLWWSTSSIKLYIGSALT